MKRINAAAGVFHLVQGIVMLTLGFLLKCSRDIYTFYLKVSVTTSIPPTFIAVPNPQVLFTISNLEVILASFPLISAIAHFTIA